jgi:hypothetical protein
MHAPAIDAGAGCPIGPATDRLIDAVALPECATFMT